MSLLDDLQALDLTAVLEARATITVAVDGDEIRALTDGRAAEAALGEIGAAVAALRSAAESPEALFAPLLDALAEAAGGLDPDSLPISEYAEAVREGARLAADLRALLDGDLSRLAALGGLPLGDVLDTVRRTLGEYAAVTEERIEPFTALVRRVERGVPQSPAALAELALDALLPFERDRLEAVRRGLDGLLADFAGVELSAEVAVQLRVSLDALAEAAATGTDAEVEAALAALARARADALASLGAALADVRRQLDGLRLRQRLAPLAEAAATVRAGQQDVFGLFEGLRLYVDTFRVRVEAVSAEDLRALFGEIDALFDAVEAAAQENLLDPLDARVAELEAWVRGLLAHLRLRALRGRVRSFFEGAAEAVRAADLDRAAEALADLLEAVRAAVADLDLEAEIGDALGGLADAVGAAADAVADAVDAIAAAVDALADEAEAVLEPVTEALAQFRAHVDEARAAVERLDVEGAANQVIDAIRELREKAEDLLSNVALPEGLKPLVDGLVAELEGIDLEGAIWEPVDEALGRLRLPAEVEATVTEALGAASDALDNLVPTRLIAEIEAEVEGALAAVADLDPSALAAGLDAYVVEAADGLAALDPRPALDAVRQPYVRALGALDAVHPARLLAPVLDAYDTLVGEAEALDVAAKVEETRAAVEARGEEIGEALVAPMRSFAEATSGSEVGVRPADAPPEPPLPLPEGARPGDVVRLFAFVPEKLREGLAALDAGPAGEVARRVDALCGGLARDLRRLDAAVWDVEDRLDAALAAALDPLTAASLRAQFALAARAEIGPLDLSASLTVTASASPDSLRADLAAEVEATRQAVAEAFGLVRGTAGGPLAAAAHALDACRLPSLEGGLGPLVDALDPEPLAAAVDELVALLYRRLLALLPELEAEVRELVLRVVDLVGRLNPVALAQKFFGVVEVVREELAVLDPHTLVADLAPVHDALREAFVAYDPAAFADEIGAVLDETAAQLRALRPSAVLDALDLTALTDAVARAGSVDVAGVLGSVGGSLEEVGRALALLNPAELLEVVVGLADRVEGEFRRAVEAVLAELIRLIESIEYASVHAEARVSVGGASAGVLVTG